MKNHLKGQSSPYLLQHADNPVEWYPWCYEAFQKARVEDKPVFLSIGYSTCHWCHVMAHESFEDEEIAGLLNRYFVSIKVDKEERPDVDSVYMAVCQAFTGSGGWPTSVFMTAEQIPFFAGTYFPKSGRHGMTGFDELLRAIHKKWETDRQSLLNAGDEVMEALREHSSESQAAQPELMEEALAMYRRTFDRKHGGFGMAPKFPTPHNLLFLLDCAHRSGDKNALNMAETTLTQMFLGGIFDHIGFGFSRYSTDRYFLIPHFEKMLYDNALLMLCYAKAYAVTYNEFYLSVAEKTATYLLREMQCPQGGFYSAQDADSDGVEGKYYAFEPDEIVRVLGKEDGEAFSRRFNITAQGNFEGKSIPNLLQSREIGRATEMPFPKLYEYRKTRCKLHLDDKILTAWNAMSVAGFALLFRVSAKAEYLEAAKRAAQMIETVLCEGETLFVSYRDGKRGGPGFLDDYAYWILALIFLYDATLDREYLEKAKRFALRTAVLFEDEEQGGFFLSGKKNEALIMKPKETYDGAVPSGNSVMAYVLVKLYHLTKEQKFEAAAEKQLAFLSRSAKEYPAGHSFFLLALSLYTNPPESVVVVRRGNDDFSKIHKQMDIDASVRILQDPTKEYQMLNDQTTFYVCRGKTCLPPTNEWTKVGK